MTFYIGKTFSKIEGCATFAIKIKGVSMHANDYSNTILNLPEGFFREIKYIVLWICYTLYT